jgi:hypothetical protein
MESSYLKQNKHKNRNDIYNGGMLTTVLNNFFFKKMPINMASKNFITLQILQPISIIREYLRDSEGADPQGIKFTMLAVVLLGCIPF